MTTNNVHQIIQSTVIIAQQAALAAKWASTLADEAYEDSIGVLGDLQLENDLLRHEEKEAEKAMREYEQELMLGEEEDAGFRRWVSTIDPTDPNIDRAARKVQETLRNWHWYVDDMIMQAQEYETERWYGYP